MFLDNKYKIWYYRIIAKAQANPVEGFVEKHHIIPSSLGGSNEESNLVALSARAHFVCHLLLTKMLVGKARSSMLYAAHNMVAWRKTDIHISSRIYKMLKEDLHAMRVGATFTDEHCKNISTALKGKLKSKEHRLALSLAKTGKPNGRKGAPFSDEHKANISKARAGTLLSEAHKKAISKGGKGRKLSPEHIEKNRQVHLGLKRSAETRERISQSLLGKVCKPMKLWKLQDPKGQIIETFELKKFCKLHRLGLSKLLGTQETKKPVEAGFSTGWMILGASYP